jgi:DNA-binding response OmpR family regulator
MRTPQIVVYESDRGLAEMLRGTAEVWGWPLRELRDEAALLRALRQGGPSVLVMEIAGDIERDLSLLDRLTWLCPEVRAIAVSNVASEELVGLAWELGAAFVLAPPQPRDILLPLVLGLMETAKNE